MEWILLIVFHVVAFFSWYRVSRLPNSGTGGLSTVVFPLLFTLILAIIDICIIIYQAYNYFIG